MSRMAGHALRHRAWDEDAKGFAWHCECGHELGVMTVHRARAAWREHKALIVAAPGELSGGAA